MDRWVQARARASAGEELCNEPDGGADADDGGCEDGDGGGGEGTGCGAGEGEDGAHNDIAGGDGDKGERAVEWRKG